MDPIATLYEAFSKIEDAEDKASEVQSYQTLLDAVKGDAKMKQLTAGFIPRFFHCYPDLAETAINAQLDLCEDEEQQIRLHAIRGLAELCKNSPSVIARISDVLGQLLVTADHMELSIVKGTFTAVFALDASAAFVTLLTLIQNGEDPLRARAIEFVTEQFKALRSSINKDEDLQRTLADSIKKILTHDSGVTGQEFSLFMDILRGFKAINNDPEFAGQFIEILLSQAGINKAFEAGNEEQVDKFVSCLRQGGKYFAKGADNRPFVDYFFSKVVPALAAVPDNQRLQIAKAVAVTSRHCTAQTARDFLPAVIELFKANAPSSAEEAKDAKVDFSFVECVLYMLHQLGSKAPSVVHDLLGLFRPTGQPGDFMGDIKERKADILNRLGALRTACDAYVAEVKLVLKDIQQAVKGKDKNDEEKKELQAKRRSIQGSLRVTDAIKALTVGLMKESVEFAGQGTRLSWQQQQGKKKPQQQQQQQQGKGKGKGKGNKQQQQQQKGKRKQPQGQQGGKKKNQNQQQGKKQKQAQQSKKKGGQKRKQNTNKGKQQQQQSNKRSKGKNQQNKKSKKGKGGRR